MQYKDLTREQVIEALIKESISYLWNEDRDLDFIDNDHAVLKVYLREGFTGFANRSDEELKNEWELVFGAEEDAA
jgi:hypothetical protein